MDDGEELCEWWGLFGKLEEALGEITLVRAEVAEARGVAVVGGDSGGGAGFTGGGSGCGGCVASSGG